MREGLRATLERQKDMTVVAEADDGVTAVARFRAQGAMLGDPFETPVCFMSFGTDPDGNQFGIHQRKKT